MSGRKSRNKGKVGERLARDLLRSLGFGDARRGQQYSGTEGRDVVCLETLPALHFEVKYGYGKVTVGSELLNSWWKQARCDAFANDREPIVLWKPDRARQWRATCVMESMLVTVATDGDIKRMIERLVKRAEHGLV